MKYKDYEILEEIPKGWRIIEGQLTAPKGCKWFRNGKSMFIEDGNGGYMRNPDYKQQLVFVDKELFFERYPEYAIESV